MTAESHQLAVLRRRFTREVAAVPRFALGVAPLDRMLGGGLMHGRLHEVLAASAVDNASATGFALMLLLRAARDGPIAWIARDARARHRARVHGPGLVELGADPARILFVDTADEAAALKTVADVARSPAIAAVLVAPGERARLFDLTATRRLTLAAEQSGATVVLLRGATAPVPTAAASRWRVAAAPSRPLEADAPGHPAFAVELLRHRGGIVVPHWRLEWDRDARAFIPPLPGRALSVPAVRRVG